MKIYIDDIREMPRAFDVCLRSYKESIQYFQNNPFPEFISFDHDLGEEKSGYDIVKWIINAVMDGLVLLPENFTFRCHSANPVGKRNIEETLGNFLREYTGKNQERQH